MKLFPRESRWSSENKKSKQNFLLINGLIATGFMVALSLLLKVTDHSGSPVLRSAAENMEQSLKIISNYSSQHNLTRDNPEDFRQTGMIGPEYSDLVTTIGDPEAKRTTINPNFAALIAHLLLEAGVKKGDTIAIGSSASFPALLIASLSASKALELTPIVIFSFGSSSFGASDPDFTLWDMYRLLLENQMIDFKPVAASFGGEDDTGNELDTALLNRIRISLKQEGIPLISESGLEKTCSVREQYYFNDHPHRIKAFINSGGGFANIGSSATVLNIKPGLVRKARIPGPEKQGMIHSMLKNKIPVIHLLFIKGLTQKYNLPWDPVSQPQITDQSVRFNGRHHPGAFIISLIGLLWFSLVLIRFRMLYNSR